MSFDSPTPASPRHALCNRCSVTRMSHLLDDFQPTIGEDDGRHVDEVISLHNLERNLSWCRALGAAAKLMVDAITARGFAEVPLSSKRLFQNSNEFRIAHQQVFDESPAKELCERCGFKFRRECFFIPYNDVYCLEK